MNAPYAEWVHRWQAALDACQRKGSYHTNISIGPPASAEAIAAVETALGQPLPLSFRRVLCEFSAEVNVYWSLVDGIHPPASCPQITRGECTWSLSRMVEIGHWYQEWLKVFDVNDRYDRVWFGKLAFAEVGNGDNIAFDVEHAEDAHIIYLSHEGDDGNGYCLGSNFMDYVDKHSLLGCAGREGWLLMPFLPDAKTGLDAHGENARKWREWFGLDFEVNTP